MHHSTSEKVLLAGFMPSRAARWVLALMSLGAGLVCVSGFLYAALQGYTIDTQDAWVIGVTMFLFGAFAAFWASYYCEVCLDLAANKLTERHKLFGLGRTRSYRMEEMTGIRIERCFVGRASRIRFNVYLDGSPEAQRGVCLGSYFRSASAREQAENISRLTRLPIHYVDNATATYAAKRVGRLFRFAFTAHRRLPQAIFQFFNRLFRSLQ